jgi:hypothetical protein
MRDFKSILRVLLLDEKMDAEQAFRIAERFASTDAATPAAKAPATASSQAELELTTDTDTYQRKNEDQPSFIMRVCEGTWRRRDWIAARIRTQSEMPKTVVSSACNKLVDGGKGPLEVNGRRNDICYRMKVQA